MGEHITVVGAGLIGRAWAIVFAGAGYMVSIYDSSKTAVDNVLRQIEASVEDLIDAGLVSQREGEGILGRVVPYNNLAEAVHGASYVQEAVAENLQVKQTVFAELEAVVDKQTILATSTSALLPSAIFGKMAHKGRCLVAHPVNPPYLIPLVELVPGPETDSAVVMTTKEIMNTAGQKPIVLTREYPGFVLNRLQVALVNEALSIVRNGIASMEDVDEAVKSGLGWRWVFMGPFETIDLNAPDGIRDYLTRFQDMYALAKDFQPQAPFSEEQLDRFETERRRTLSRTQLGQRARWRDQKLMRIARFLKNN